MKTGRAFYYILKFGTFLDKVAKVLKYILKQFLPGATVEIVYWLLMGIDKLFDVAFKWYKNRSKVKDLKPVVKVIEFYEKDPFNVREDFNSGKVREVRDAIKNFKERNGKGGTPSVK